MPGNKEPLYIGIVVIVVIAIAALFLFKGLSAGSSFVSSVSPSSASLNLGQSATLVASATGGQQPYTFQWYNDTSGTPVPIAGQTGVSLVVSGMGTGTFVYYVSVADSTGKTISSHPASVVVSSQDLSATIASPVSSLYVGQQAILTASASGGLPPYSFQWYNNTSGVAVAMPGENSTAFTLTATGNGSFKYSVMVSDSETHAKSAYSSAFKLNVTTPQLNVSVSPTTSTTYVGQAVSLTASSAYGTKPYSYQWYNDTSGVGTAMAGQTGQTLLIDAIEAGTYKYYVSVTDSETPSKTSYSKAAAIIVNATPVIKVKLTNFQPAPTPVPFQQMIKFNAQQYSQYESQNLGNIRFYEGPSELYSWCESGCSSGSSVAIFWVKFPDGIAADSSVTLNITFLPAHVNYDGNYAGEAPQLSSTYAQYDNGHNVFGSYYNFAGTSLPAGLNVAANNGCSYSATINNGYTIMSCGTLYSTATYSPNMVFDSYGYASGAVSSTPGIRFDMGFEGGSLGTWGWPSTMVVGAIGGGPYCGSNYTYFTQVPDEYDCVQSSYALGVTKRVLSIEYTTNPSAVYSINYSNVTTITSDVPTVPLPIGAEDSVASASLFIQWMRTRAYPPSGVMPSVSFGR